MAEGKDEDNLVLLGDGDSFKGELCSMIERTQMFKDFARADVELSALAVLVTVCAVHAKRGEEQS